jgi:hypothetical protein
LGLTSMRGCGCSQTSFVEIANKFLFLSSYH